jgi:DNA-binding response OmpR family regulator
MDAIISDISICALLVGDYQDERLRVNEIFQRSGWRLLEAPDRRRALDYLDRHPVHVVIADSDAPGWNWKRVLRDLRRRRRPPELVVTSRLADDALWSEVLNLGGYDVLVRPLAAEEVERVVAGARRQFDRQPAGIAHSAHKPLYQVA